MMQKQMRGQKALSRPFMLTVTEIRSLWPRIKDFAQKIGDYSEKADAADYQSAALRGHCQFWVDDVTSPNVLVITKIETYPKKKILKVDGAGGTKLSAWKHMITDLERFGRLNDCDEIEIWGRVGWQRVFPDYRLARVRLDKPL